MTNFAPQPISFHPGPEKTLEVSWSSGELHRVSYFEIRFHCPCAGCVDEHTGKRILSRDQISPEVKPVRILPIGRYAIQIQWSDRHETGIYSFDQLYKLGKNHSS